VAVSQKPRPVTALPAATLLALTPKVRSGGLKGGGGLANSPLFANQGGAIGWLRTARIGNTRRRQVFRRSVEAKSWIWMVVQADGTDCRRWRRALVVETEKGLAILVTQTAQDCDVHMKNNISATGPWQANRRTQMAGVAKGPIQGQKETSPGPSTGETREIRARL